MLRFILLDFMLTFYFNCRLEKQVRDVVHKAFWDKLREELNQDPPTFNQAMSLIEEVKQVNCGTAFIW